MKRDDEKGKEKQVSAKTLQAMPPNNVLATRYLREANKKFKLGDYAEAAEVYKQAIDYFEIAHGGVSISKSNYTNAICNWVTTLYYNRKYEEALEALNTYILLKDVQYIDLSIILHTQKDLCYNLGLVHIAEKDFPNALKNLSTSNALGQSVVALYNMGYAENLQKHFKEAHDYYDQALQLAIKSSKNTLLIDKAIKNNITEYFIELCHTSNPMDEFESLAGRKSTYEMIYEQLPDLCLKHAKYLLNESLPVTDIRKSITNINTAVLMFNRLAKLYSQVTEEASQELLSIKLQISHDYWDLLNTYSYIKTKQCLPSYEVDESLDDSSTILGSRVELLEESFSEKPSIKKLLKELTDTRPCELILEYLSSDYDTIVNLTLEYLGEEDICAQMAGLIQEKLSLESEI